VRKAELNKSLPEAEASRRIADPVPFAVSALSVFLEYDAT
jgi:hypothetical protein